MKVVWSRGRFGISSACELIVVGTPYIIPYRVRRERLELIAVFHGRQEWPTTLSAGFP